MLTDFKVSQWMQSFQVVPIPDVVFDSRRIFSCEDTPELWKNLIDKIFTS